MHFSKLPFINLRHPADRLCLDEGTADLSTTLPGAKVDVLLGSGGLLDFFLTLGQDELDVARVSHVGVDLVECQLATLPLSLYLLSFYPQGYHIHDREHGRCVSVPWGPG